MSQADDGYVLDASALLALLKGEAGKEVVARGMDGAAISTVNLCEVLRRVGTLAQPVENLPARLKELGLQFVAFGEDDAEEAARLTAVGRPLGLSLADGACLALAGRMRRVALTADRVWSDLDVGIRIELIR